MLYITFPITYKANYLHESVWNNLFYNETSRLLFIFERFHLCFRKTKNSSKMYRQKYYIKLPKASLTYNRKTNTYMIFGGFPIYQNEFQSTLVSISITT